MRPPLRALDAYCIFLMRGDANSGKPLRVAHRFAAAFIDLRQNPVTNGSEQ
jgi:hypothetical protein